MRILNIKGIDATWCMNFLVSKRRFSKPEMKFLSSKMRFQRQLQVRLLKFHIISVNWSVKLTLSTFIILKLSKSFLRKWITTVPFYGLLKYLIFMWHLYIVYYIWGFQWGNCLYGVLYGVYVDWVIFNFLPNLTFTR